MQQGFSSKLLLGRRRWAFFCHPLIAVAALAFAASATPSAAQDPGAAVWARGGCANCHGGLAEGGEGGDMPAGPSLRQTTLDRDTLRETVSCGRGAMPFNLKGAYSEISCYGIPLGDPPAGFRGGAQLSPDEIDTLVEFLFEYVVGATKVTRDGCAVFFGGNPRSPVCATYPLR